MAKYNPNASKKQKANIYPSEFGSHKTMINTDYLKFNDGNLKFVVCLDGRGSYITERVYLDNGLCDFNRSANIKRRELVLTEMTHE